MIYTSTTEIALRALIYLAQQPPGAYSPIGQIAKQLGLRHPMLSKVLQRLGKLKLVNSQKGPGGGFALSKHPKTISLLTAIIAVEGNLDWDRCALGLKMCSDDKPCPLHQNWKKVRENIKKYLETTTIYDLAGSQNLNDREIIRSLRASQ
jgi:Rrf2 family protein